MGHFWGTMLPAGRISSTDSVYAAGDPARQPGKSQRPQAWLFFRGTVKACAFTEEASRLLAQGCEVPQFKH